MVEAELLADVLANPEDDAPRLVLADWWLQHGDPRGELVVAQIEHQRPGADTDALAARATALIAQHQDAWLAPLSLEAQEVTWRRGFVDELRIRGNRLDKLWRRIFAAHPIRHAHPHFLRYRAAYAAVCALPWPRSLTSLKLDKAQDRDCIDVVADSPVLAQLRSLEVSRFHITDTGLARMLAAAPVTLRDLDLYHNELTTAGVRRLVARPWQRLVLGHNQLDAGAAAAIARGPHAGELAYLNLMGNPIGPGALALAASSDLGGLRDLLLMGCQLGTTNTAAIASSPAVAQLKMLLLGDNDAGPDAARALAGSAFAALEYLGLSGNPLGDAGAALLAEADGLARLAHLDLSESRLTSAGALALAKSPKLASLRRLTLRGNSFGTSGGQLGAAGLRELDLSKTSLDADGAERLASCPEAASLVYLDASTNAIGRRGGLALARSPHLANLRSLMLWGCDLDDDVKAAVRERFGPGVYA